jgi:porphobilinogen synthase
MVRETRISKASLIYPLFIKEGSNVIQEIASMPGQFRYSVDRLPVIANRLLAAGVSKVMLFGIPDDKDEIASGAYCSDGIVQKALQKLKKDCPDLYCITDVCLCEYTSHGHCGVLNVHSVDNDATLPLLAKTALSHVQAGADMVAPSDMMDGRVGAIRRLLDQSGYTDIPVMSYAVKYCSSFYGPFREAAGSAPSFGDRKSYQMDYHNKKEALREALLDSDEGADILMVKPALSYLDVIQTVSSAVNLPLAAYSVSGEYAMVKAAAASGYIDEAAIVCETTASVFRAGADILISYFAPDIAGYIDEGRIG